MKEYWHFLPSDRKLQFGSREVVKVKHTLLLPPETKIVPCAVGFHASKRAIDALQYAPGPIICRVTLHGEIVRHGNPIDKYAAHGRTVLWMADATETLRAFARWCALEVIHLWNASPVVKEYLQTGDEKLRSAASDAAWAASDAAALAASDAAWAAARAAALAARDAARDAARAAARAAALAASDAARDAARAAALAASDAAWAAAREKQNTKLEEMLLSLK